MTIRTPIRLGAELETAGDVISMWCFSEEGLSHEDSPLIRIHDARGPSLPDMPFLKTGQSLPKGKWVRLNFPLPNFENLYRSTSDSRFNPKRIGRIAFCQRLDDGKEHTLYIDDIRVVKSGIDDSQPPAAPQELVVEGRDSHCDLEWKAVEDDDL